MSRIVVLYMSREGQTKKIADTIAQSLSQAGHDVHIGAITQSSVALDQADAVVLGCPIRYGRHLGPFRAFVDRHGALLSRKPGFFFSVNLTARKPERAEPHNNRYLQKYLASIEWQPDKVEVFAGALLYSRYDFFNRAVIRLIMKITGGPTDTSRDIEFTDWTRVAAFARDIDLYLGQACGSDSGLGGALLSEKTSEKTL